MHADNKFLTHDDIMKMAPRSLIMHVIGGVVREHGLSISVMLDKDEDDAELSRGTGKVFITDTRINGQAAYCAMLRAWPDESVSKRCGVCDRTHFGHAKKTVMANPNYEGEIYWCSAGNLWDFVVPIVEKESNTFVGVIFGGQKRPKESRLKAWSRLKDLVTEQGNRSLASIPFWKLYWNYLKVGQATEEELQEMKSKCEKIAHELAKPFELLVQIRKAEYERRTEQEAINRIDQLIISARNFKDFCGSMNAVLIDLQQWLRFDWGMVLGRKGSRNDEEVFEVRGVIGRGIGLQERLQGKEFAFPSAEINEAKEIRLNPEFLRRDVCSMISGQPEWWWIPLVTCDGSMFGATILGSAPEHRNTQYDRQRIQEREQRLKEIATKMATKHSELDALKSTKQKTVELRHSQKRMRTTVRQLEDTLIGLTHQLKRPLVMVRGALSNVRDRIYDHTPRHIMNEDIELGIIATEHAELMCKGISKIFTPKGTSSFEYTSVQIDAKKELRTLCEAMRQVSGRKDISFSHFEENPIIEMDEDSFLYVFYALIDNAIKYSDPYTTISLVYAEERDTGRYALKVKSIGLPIAPGYKDRVFERFWRHPDAWQYDETGIGLGCWAAREHMQRQGGDITLEAVGRLSVFIVHLPPTHS